MSFWPGAGWAWRAGFWERLEWCLHVWRNHAAGIVLEMRQGLTRDVRRWRLARSCGQSSRLGAWSWARRLETVQVRVEEDPAGFWSQVPLRPAAIKVLDKALPLGHRVHVVQICSITEIEHIVVLVIFVPTMRIGVELGERVQALHDGLVVRSLGLPCKRCGFFTCGISRERRRNPSQLTICDLFRGGEIPIQTGARPGVGDGSPSAFCAKTLTKTEGHAYETALCR